MDAIPRTGPPSEPVSSGETAAPDILAGPDAGPAAVRGGVLRVGGYVVGAAVSVVSASLLFRHLGVVDVGRYVTALSLVAIVAAVSDLGLTAVAVRELSRVGPDDRGPLAQDVLGLRLLLTAVGGVAIVAIAWAAYGPQLAAGVALATAGLALLVVHENFALPLLVGLRLGWVTAFELGRQLLTVALTIVLVLAGAGLLPFLAISIPVGALAAVLTAVLVRASRALRPTFDWQRWRPLVLASLPYAAAVAASALYFRASVLLVSALASPEELGYFSASFRVVEVLTVVPGLLVGSALPIFARAAGNDHDRLGYGLGKVFEVCVVVGAGVAVAFAVGAPLAITIIGGDALEPAAPVLAFQGLALGATFVTLVWANALLSLGLFRTILLVTVLGLAVNLGLVAVLTLTDGARGAALGTALAEVFLVVVQCAAVVRGRPELRPSFRVVPRAALAAAVALTPLLLTGVPVGVRLALSLSLYAAAILLLRALPRELLDLVPARRGAGTP